MPSITIKQEVSWKRVADLLCCAFEGGSNYWYRIERFKKPRSGADEFRHLSYPTNPGGELIVSDHMIGAGPAKEIRAKVNQKTLARGLQLMADKYPQHFADFVAGNDDATTGDVFLQLVCFGEVIYG